jgi:hypothetical protein
VQSLSAEEILQLWERGEGEPPAQRSLFLLARARPELTPGDLGALTVGDGQLALLGLRARTFGSDLEAVASCPACNAVVEFGIDVRRLAPPDALQGDGGGDGGGVVSGPGHRDPAPYTATFEGGWQIVYRVPTVADLAPPARGAGPPRTREWLLDRCVVEARGPDGDPSSAADLPPPVVAALAAAMAERDPAAELTTELGCPDCKHLWLATLDAGDFCWSEVAALARRLIREVHELAARYGWSEAELLRLTARRRHAYLEQVWS